MVLMMCNKTLQWEIKLVSDNYLNSVTQNHHYPDWIISRGYQNTAVRHFQHQYFQGQPWIYIAIK